MGRPHYRLLLLKICLHRRRIMEMTFRARKARQQSRALKKQVATLIRQLNAASLAFVFEQRALQIQRSQQPLPEVQPNQTRAAATQTDSSDRSISVQTSPDWTTAVADEVHACNARRFRAEALLRAANLPLIPANYKG